MLNNWKNGMSKLVLSLIVLVSFFRFNQIHMQHRLDKRYLLQSLAGSGSKTQILHSFMKALLGEHILTTHYHLALHKSIL